jgi:hypothetical protein
MRSDVLPTVLVTHPKNRLDQYFEDLALERLGKIANIRLNENNADLSGAALQM